MIKTIKPRVRIAPSPTGVLHIGTARTALFNYLFAKKYDGNFILRIEDTDKERSDAKYEKDIIDGLKWLGLEWTEGPEKDGKYGPYKQSERMPIYAKYLEKLLSEGKAYYCFCSEDELNTQKEYLRSIGQSLIYSGKCKDLSTQEVVEKLKNKEPFIIRFKTPNRKVKFKDLIRGDLEFDSSLIGDIAIAKSLTLPLYNFAVVVDDFEMKISHIIRGEDLLSNTPKQILIQEALGFSQPKYAHLPLILGSDKSKLSKRHGAVGLLEYKRKGYLPETMINFIAFLGWNPGTEKEIFSLKSLIKEFSLEKVQSGGAIFNIKRLEFLNAFYVRQKSVEKITEFCIPYFIKAGFIEVTEENISKPLVKLSGQTELIPKQKFKIKETGEIIDQNYLERIISLYHERLKIFSEITELTDFFFKKEIWYERDLLIWKDIENHNLVSAFAKLGSLLFKIEDKDWSKDNLEKILMPEAEKFGKEIGSEKGDRGYLLWPLRVSLTGHKNSAGPFEIAEILGKEKTLKRIKNASSKLN